MAGLPPRATYRVQLHGLGLRGASRLVPYLARLGISHLYASPVLRATQGSTHGYDVVDPHELDPALGDDEDWEALHDSLREQGLGLVLDIVPNHLAITPENPAWWDVLENGRASRFAPLFDVDWNHPEPALRDRILMPLLDDQYGRVLEAGELRLVREGASFLVTYHDHRLPIAPRTVDGLLSDAAEACGSDELAVLAETFGALLPSAPEDGARDDGMGRFHRDRTVLKRLLGRLLEDPAVAEAVDAAVTARNLDPDALDVLLERQAYRLAFWRAAGRDLGYRRFFDVSSLAGIRVEEPWVFQETHARILGWVRDGAVDGLRVDHPDGLRDPAAYLNRLTEAAPGVWVVVEKILQPGERLRPWPVAGTTGYDAMARIDALFVDPAGEDPLRAAFAAATGELRAFAEISREARLEVLHDALGSELNRLTALGLRVLERHRRHRDHTRHDVHEALRELAASLPVYRTYVRADAGAIELEGADAIASAMQQVRQAREDVPPDLLEFLRDVLLLRVRGDLEGELAMRFQQLTGAVMAKGVEDTAFYRYLPLLSLCEVGGDPSHFGIEPAAFHEANAVVADRWPASMIAGSTHDTKRSEDARARLHVLSLCPREWLETVERLRSASVGHRRGDLPDGHSEWLLWQTLLAAWPIDAERLTAVLIKSLREADLRTSWSRVDVEYERDVTAFASAAIADPAVIDEMERFVGRIEPAARVISLATTLLRLTLPGVPDIYQGTEVWAHFLVDPDNRQPVDFAARERLLEEIAEADAGSVLVRAEEGAPKLWLIARTLAVRAADPSAFAEGSYEPLETGGAEAERLVGFVRAGRIAAIVPRLVVDGQPPGEASATLPHGAWRDALTGTLHPGGAPLDAGELLAGFPVALLVREADDAEGV